MSSERKPMGNQPVDQVYEQVMQFIETRKEAAERAWREYERARNELEIANAQAIVLEARTMYIGADEDVIEAYAMGLAKGRDINLEDYEEEIQDILDAIGE